MRYIIDCLGGAVVTSAIAVLEVSGSISGSDEMFELSPKYLFVTEFCSFLFIICMYL